MKDKLKNDVQRASSFIIHHSSFIIYD